MEKRALEDGKGDLKAFASQMKETGNDQPLKLNLV
jgi:hypothetical protein